MKYKCIKEVEAFPMGRTTAQAKGLVRDKVGINEKGYHVIYDNGAYESWSPADSFERGYIPIEEVEADEQ